MMAPVIGTDADVDGSDQAAYLRYLLFMSVVTVARRFSPARLDAYLLYMLIVLVAIIAVVTALA